jgi:hypothetical protein
MIAALLRAIGLLMITEVFVPFQSGLRIGREARPNPRLAPSSSEVRRPVMEKLSGKTALSPVRQTGSAGWSLASSGKPARECWCMAAIRREALA